MATLESKHASTICSGPENAGHSIIFPATIGDDVPEDVAQWLVAALPAEFWIVSESDGASTDADGDADAEGDDATIDGSPAEAPNAPRRREQRVNA